MLKWLLLLLLVVNLGVYLWGVQKENARQPKEIIATPGMGNLRIVKEDEEEKDQPAQLPSAGENSVENQDVIPEGVSPTPDKERSPTIVSEQRASIVGNKAEDEVDRNFELASSQDYSVDATVVQSSSRLVDSNLYDDEVLLASEKFRSSGLQPALLQRCGSLEPVKRLAEAERLKVVLTESGARVTINDEQLKQVIGYWVIIPPLDSKEAAAEYVKRLKDAGVKDVRRFNKGKEKNGISLGVFSRRKNAEIRQAEVAKKGVETAIEARSRTVPGYRLDYQVSGQESIGALERVLESLEPLKSSKKSCQFVAN